MSINQKDLLASLAFTAIGLFFALIALRTLDLGSPEQMGPGYFPLVLGGLLVIIGIGMALRSVSSGPAAITSIPWRGTVLVAASVILFGATIRGLGLVAATGLAAIVSAYASRDMTLPFAVALAVGLSLFCVVVFHLGLGLPLPLRGPWLGG